MEMDNGVQFHVLAWLVIMSPMPSYNMDSERLSPSPVHSPGEILSPRVIIKSPGKAEMVVPVDHVKDVIIRVTGDVRHNLQRVRKTPSPPKENEGYITSSDMENALKKMKLQIVQEIRLNNISLEYLQHVTSNKTIVKLCVELSVHPILNF